jgi:hypothetical protein
MRWSMQVGARDHAATLMLTDRDHQPSTFNHRPSPSTIDHHLQPSTIAKSVISGGDFDV